MFDWRKRESHVGYWLTSVLLVAAVFAGLFGIGQVGVATDSSPGFASASVLYLPNDALGRSWRLMAEEAGPFPGGLESVFKGEGMDSFGFSAADDPWSYEVPLVPFRPVEDREHRSLARKGSRFFPRGPVAAPLAVRDASDPVKVRNVPVLVPYDREAQEWMPDELPTFGMKMEEGVVPATWRFLLDLRSDGTVERCVELSGSGGKSASEICQWLSGVSFKPGAEDRWLGLRVEFINK